MTMMGPTSSVVQGARGSERVERRRYPRARAGLTILAPENFTLVDISPYGARVATPARLAAGSTLTLRLGVAARALKGDVTARVVERLAGEGADAQLRLVFEHIDSDLQREILRAAKAQVLCDGLRDTAARVSTGASPGHRALTSAERRDAVAARLVAEGATLTMARMHRGRVVSGRILEHDHAGRRVLVSVPEPGALGRCGRPVACCAQAGHESVLLTARVICYRDGGAVLLLPNTVWLTERRSAERNVLTAADAWRLVVDSHWLRVLDHSEGGLALHVPSAVRLTVGEPRKAVLRRPGMAPREVVILPRHERSAPDGRIVGVAFAGEARLQATGAPVARRTWTAEEVTVCSTPRAVVAERVIFGPATRPLAGLWMEPGPGEGAPSLIVIPPAWGRTKESSALVAQALVATFAARGSRVAVLRIDYAETLGESHRSEIGAESGREALGLTVSGCASDLRAALTYGLSRLASPPARVVLLGMSFSGPLCLRVAATDDRVTHLAQMMGASDIQDLVRTATGGIDYVARYRSGLHNGIENVLGLLCDVDRWCSDGLREQLLLLTHAQRDAGRLDIPLLWVQGQYDAFVNPERVGSILDAAASPSRHLAVVPCGHVPSRTREAVVGLAPVVEWLLGPGPVTIPRADLMKEAQAREWACAPRETLASPAEYWRDYMMGDSEGALGFDVLTLTREYGAMMQLQAELLELSPGKVVHDIGGGAGYSVPYLAQASSEVGVVLYDLVAPLLDKARARWADGAVTLDTCVWDADQAVPESLAGADRVLMSLFLTVLREPAAVLRRVVAALPPGAVVVASSVRPDADLSLVYARLLADVSAGRVQPPAGVTKQRLVTAIREYVCTAAHLLRLAEEGTFCLYEPGELVALLEAAGLVVDTVRPCFGEPARAVVVRATKPA